MLLHAASRYSEGLHPHIQIWYIQGPHGKLVQKENLSHTLKNKVFSLIFLVFHDNNILKRIKTNKIDEATLCFGDTLDYSVVVGLGERTLLPGHVREWGIHGGLQGVQSVLVAPVDDSFAGFQKNNSLGGCRGERFINKSVVSSLGMSANPVTMEAFRELKLLWWFLLMIRAPLQPQFFWK